MWLGLNIVQGKLVITDLFCDRLARADAAKRLLDLGADANAQDITGRTPLHTAVAADAMGVFQVIFMSFCQCESITLTVVFHGLCSVLEDLGI